MRHAVFALAAIVLAAPACAQSAAPPDLSGFWNLDYDPGDPDPELVAKLPPNTVLLADTGVAEFPEGEYGGLEVKPAALAHAEAWTPSDEMTLQRVCLPPSIVYGLQGPFPFEIYQYPQLIVIRMEYFDQVRLVFMDGRGHPPADAPHSKVGHSIGHWDGDELVIDTTHIAASTITNNGLDHGDGIHMVERYKLSPDGQRIQAMQWFEDPETLDNNGARYIEWTKREGQFVYPYECDPSFALEYQQAGEGE